MDRSSTKNGTDVRSDSTTETASYHRIGFARIQIVWNKLYYKNKNQSLWLKASTQIHSFTK